jgi:hypothetical protein
VILVVFDSGVRCGNGIFPRGEVVEGMKGMGVAIPKLRIDGQDIAVFVWEEKCGAPDPLVLDRQYRLFEFLENGKWKGHLQADLIQDRNTLTRWMIVLADYRFIPEIKNDVEASVAAQNLKRSCPTDDPAYV